MKPLHILVEFTLKVPMREVVTDHIGGLATLCQGAPNLGGARPNHLCEVASAMGETIPLAIPWPQWLLLIIPHL